MTNVPHSLDEALFGGDPFLSPIFDVVIPTTTPKCLHCKLVAPRNAWRADFGGYCDDCGEHWGIYCPNCKAFYDPLGHGDSKLEALALANGGRRIRRTPTFEDKVYGVYTYAKETLELIGGDLESTLARMPLEAVMLINGVYEPDIASHRTLADVPAEALATAPMPLTNVTVGFGQLRADDVHFETNTDKQVLVGAVMVFCPWVDEIESSMLVCCRDFMPVFADGNGITMQWDQRMGVMGL
jgi:hypothetical protein